MYRVAVNHTDSEHQNATQFTYAGATPEEDYAKTVASRARQEYPKRDGYEVVVQQLVTVDDSDPENIQSEWRNSDEVPEDGDDA